MVAISDASFANNIHLSSHPGYFIMNTDQTSLANVLAYTSLKIKIFVMSVLRGKIYAFANYFDAVYFIGDEQQTVFGRRIPMVMLTDSAYLFSMLTRFSWTTEKQLMIDIVTTEEIFESPGN